jgi:hypothetical protein
MSAMDTTRLAEWEPKHALRRNRHSRFAEHQETVKVLLERHGDDGHRFPPAESGDRTTLETAQAAPTPPRDPWLRPAANAFRNR